MPFDKISKLCTDFYTKVQNEHAKDILYETACTTSDDQRPHKIKPHDAGKRTSDKKDVSNVFLGAVPQYVAVDLLELPSLTMNTFGLSRIFKIMDTLKLQSKILQETQEANLVANIAQGRQHKENRMTKTTPAPKVERKDS